MANQYVIIDKNKLYYLYENNIEIIYLTYTIHPTHTPKRRLSLFLKAL